MMVEPMEIWIGKALTKYEQPQMKRDKNPVFFQKETAFLSGISFNLQPFVFRYGFRKYFFCELEKKLKPSQNMKGQKVL